MPAGRIGLGSIRPDGPERSPKSTIALRDSAVSRLDSHLTMGPKAMATMMNAKRCSQSVESMLRLGRPSCGMATSARTRLQSTSRGSPANEGGLDRITSNSGRGESAESRFEPTAMIGLPRPLAWAFSAAIPTFLAPTSPKRVEHLIRHQSLSCRPWIVSEILRFLPVSPLLYRAPPRHSLPKLVSVVAEHLSLPTHEFALDLGEFLRILYTKDLVRKVERI